jgi:hypothetical protein
METKQEISIIPAWQEKRRTAEIAVRRRNPFEIMLCLP